VVIVLVGFMGAGKSTVARALAGRLKATWVDSDAEIERVAGASIPELFVRDGEPAFRDLEHTVVAGLIDQGLRADPAPSAPATLIIALGGGAAMHAGTRRALRPPDGATPRPLVVHLKVGLDAALARVGDDANRPMLADPDLPRIHAERMSGYDRIADLVVGTDGRTAADIADEVLRSVLDWTPSGAPEHWPGQTMVRKGIPFRDS